MASPRPYVGCSAHPSRFSPIDDITCGSVQGYDLAQRLKIVGGREASSGAWPWQVAILDYKHDPICGGTLLTPEFVLTAAHCVKKKLYVRAGEHNIDIYEGTEQEQRVIHSFKNPKYNPTIVDNDIALLKLKSPFRLNQHVWPACLPPPNEELKPTTVATILGWGVVSEPPSTQIGDSSSIGIGGSGATITSGSSSILSPESLMALAINFTSSSQIMTGSSTEVSGTATATNTELSDNGSNGSSQSTSNNFNNNNNISKNNHNRMNHNRQNANASQNKATAQKRRRNKQPNRNSATTNAPLSSAKCPGSDVLLQARVPIVSAEDCRNVYKSYVISDNMICAGYKRGRVDTCAGDSGGPLLVQRANRWHVYGVTSFGEGCGKQGKYGIYSKTSNFVDWIRMMINKHSSFMTLAAPDD